MTYDQNWSGKKAFITSEIIKTETDTQKSLCYITGSPSFILAISKQLKSLA